METSFLSSRLAALRERWPVVVVFAVWCVLSCIAVRYHEPWRDEADAWLYARDAPFSSFFQGGRYGGTPMLWYVVQVPFARLGLPYGAQAWLHWGIAVVACWVFLAHARLPLFVRAAFAFSFFGLFEYAVVARSYSLTLLFLWVALACWPQRRAAPWFFVSVALLAQTNIPGMIFAGALLFLAVVVQSPVPAGRFDRRALAGAAVFYLLAIAQVWPPNDGQKEVKLSEDALGIALRTGLFPFFEPAGRALLAGLALGVIATVLVRHRAAAALFGLVFVGFALLFTFVHGGALRHFGFYFVAAIAAAWLAAHQHPQGPAGARVLAFVVGVALLPWVAEGLEGIQHERNERFSNARAMGSYIRKNNPSNMISMHVDAVAVTPWLDKGKLYYPAVERGVSYMPWNTTQYRRRGIKGHDLAKRTEKRFPDDRSVLLLLNAPIDIPSKSWELLHAEAKPTWFRHGEKLYLYRRLP
ncbi:MAG: hypothetical protein Q8O67_13285 [Deltaproteobacteria bacterium]|nr:hypothetical protein [Deltaproteobacteria bacterium]